MKINKLLIPFLSFSFLVTSCNTGPYPDTEEIDTDYYFIFGNNMDTKARFTYKNEYFTAPTTDFNKDLALMSFVAAANSGQKKEMKKFYDAIHFTNHYYTSVYDTGCGVDTYGFYTASRDIDDFTLIAFSFRSYDYTLEWVSNVTLGKEGNHEGFEYSCNNAIKEFKEYYAKNFEGKKTKIWINGFSRGGALANMFATKLMEDETSGFTMDNVYCYTFEAPACFDIENVRSDFTNIFNMSNSGDVVVNVPPSQYGLYRSGIDKDILRPDFDKLFADYMYELYPEPILDESTGEMVDKAKEWIDTIPEFQKSTKYSNETEFMEELIYRILHSSDEDYTYGIPDRAHYVDHLQTAARFLVQVFYSIDELHLYWVINNFNNTYLSKPSQMIKLAGIVMKPNGQGLYELASYYLKRIHYTFDDAELHKACENLYNVITRLGFNDMMSLYNALPNIQRALYFHWHESSYVLLRAYGDPINA